MSQTTGLGCGKQGDNGALEVIHKIHNSPGGVENSVGAWGPGKCDLVPDRRQEAASLRGPVLHSQTDQPRLAAVTRTPEGSYRLAMASQSVGGLFPTLAAAMAAAYGAIGCDGVGCT